MHAEQSRSNTQTPHWARALVVIVVAIVLAHALDGAAWAYMRDPKVNDREWGRLLRSAGYVPTWLFGAAALALASRVRWAVSLAVAPALAGGIAELIKLVVRRMRPAVESAAYRFRPFDVDPWSTKGLGLASSHTAVAFGAAAVLSRCFPRTWPVWYLLASGCAATRVMAGAHYLSDTVVAAVIGWGVGVVVWGRGGTATGAGSTTR
jgi:membrane-associated phospholipid phosphatase